MSKEAMKLALEALKKEHENYRLYGDEDGSPEYIHEAIKALEEALAKQEQGEPVAWRHKGQPWQFKTRYEITLPDVVPDSWEPLYTTPQQRTWVGLTQEDINQLWSNNANVAGFGISFETIRAVEAKLKEKNT